MKPFRSHEYLSIIVLLTGQPDHFLTPKKSLVVLSLLCAWISIFYNRKVNNRITQAFLNALPVRIVGTHFIGCSMVSQLVLPFVLHTMEPHQRYRARIHSGSNESVMSHLHEFGIARSMIPTRAGGLLDMNTATWLDERFSDESQDVF